MTATILTFIVKFGEDAKIIAIDWESQRLEMLQFFYENEDIDDKLIDYIKNNPEKFVFIGTYKTDEDQRESNKL